MMSPSMIAGPSSSAASSSYASAIGKERTLVGLSLPRQWAFSPRTSSSPASRTDSSTWRVVSFSWGKALSAMAAAAALRTSGSQELLLSHSSSVSSAISSIIDALSPRPLIGLDDAPDQRVANDVGRGEPDHRDAFDPFEAANGIGEARFRRVGEIDLVGIAANHHPAAHAEAGQEHLHLQRRRVLRLVEDDEGVVERAPAHEGDRRDFDLARGDPAFDLLGWEHVVERVVEWTQIGIDLVLHVAGEEAEPLAGLDRRTREDQPVNAAADQLRDGLGDGEIGLAGT